MSVAPAVRMTVVRTLIVTPPSKPPITAGKISKSTLLLPRQFLLAGHQGLVASISAWRPPLAPAIQRRRWRPVPAGIRTSTGT